MMKMLFFFLMLVLHGQTAGGATQELLDPRCVDGIVDVDGFTEAKRALTIDRSLYERTGKLICMMDEDKKELPTLTEKDDWPRWISLIGNLTTDMEGYDCNQFAHFYASAYRALDNKLIRRNNCSAVITLCDSCELGCPRVYPNAYSTREYMIDWALGSVGRKDTACERSWIKSNVQQALNRNATWLTDIKQSCEDCFVRECSTTRAQFTNNLLWDVLKKHSNDAESVWTHLCHYPTALGFFGHEALNLEARFNSFDEGLQLKLSFQNNSWWCFPLIIFAMIGFTAFFQIPNQYREWFNFDAFVRSYNRFKGDRLLQWVIQRLSTKAVRMRTKAANAFQRLNRKKSVKPASKVKKTSGASVVTAEPNRKKSAISDSNNRSFINQNNGNSAGPRRGPVGRGRGQGRRN